MLETIMGILRHALTFGGGILVTKGIATASEVELWTGAIVTIIGGAWSIWQKIRAKKALDAAIAAPAGSAGMPQ